jgi:hypothetical protein
VKTNKWIISKSSNNINNSSKGKLKIKNILDKFSKISGSQINIPVDVLLTLEGSIISFQSQILTPGKSLILSSKLTREKDEKTSEFQVENSLLLNN